MKQTLSEDVSYQRIEF